MPEKTLNQQTFDRMQEIIHNIKGRSIRRNDTELYGLADGLDAQLRIFVSDLIVEGRFPELSAKGA